MALDVVKWSAYPLTIALGFMAQYFFETVLGMSLLLSVNAAILLGACLITLLEFKIPARRSWLPDKIDWLHDALFLTVIQMVLPKVLTLYLALALVDFAKAQNLALESFWPHELPIAAQVILMMVVAELFRYWMHRVFHEWGPAWSLHAVHHSSHKLYWLNVARFHPLEKSIQFLADALPFILVGVSGEVLAMYKVFYAINGFYQHCNIDVRLGFLNYLISGPELHRWHHSTVIAESNNNYGNNLIIWDLVFGTYFLPKDRLVSELGLINRDYPMGFGAQMTTPFVKGLDKLKPD